MLTACMSLYLSVYTWKNACSVTAFNSTDIRSVHDKVATPVTAMMVSVCISTDALSSVFISPDLSDTNSFHQCCWSIMPVLQPVLADCNNLFPTYLYHSVTSDWYSPDNPTDCSSLIPSVLNSLLATIVWYSYDIIPVSGLKVQQAVTGLWRFCVCRSDSNSAYPMNKMHSS